MALSSSNLFSVLSRTKELETPIHVENTHRVAAGTCVGSGGKRHCSYLNHDSQSCTGSSAQAGI